MRDFLHLNVNLKGVFAPYPCKQYNHSKNELYNYFAAQITRSSGHIIG